MTRCDVRFSESHHPKKIGSKWKATVSWQMAWSFGAEQLLIRHQWAQGVGWIVGIIASCIRSLDPTGWIQPGSARIFIATLPGREQLHPNTKTGHKNHPPTNGHVWSRSPLQEHSKLEFCEPFSGRASGIANVKKMSGATGEGESFHWWDPRCSEPEGLWHPVIPLGRRLSFSTCFNQGWQKWF